MHMTMMMMTMMMTRCIVPSYARTRSMVINKHEYEMIFIMRTSRRRTGKRGRILYYLRMGIQYQTVSGLELLHRSG